ncbi:TPA: hypothetical protein ACIUHN_004157, partial [Salmonella enterica subsp. diarizonae serovar 50:k:z35]
CDVAQFVTWVIVYGFSRDGFFANTIPLRGCPYMEALTFSDNSFGSHAVYGVRRSLNHRIFASWIGIRLAHCGNECGEKRG